MNSHTTRFSTTFILSPGGHAWTWNLSSHLYKLKLKSDVNFLLSSCSCWNSEQTCVMIWASPFFRTWCCPATLFSCLSNYMSCYYSDVALLNNLNALYATMLAATKFLLGYLLYSVHWTRIVHLVHSVFHTTLLFPILCNFSKETQSKHISTRNAIFQVWDEALSSGTFTSQ